MCSCNHPSPKKHKPRIQFIIKERKAYGTKTKCYGLFNSCNFIVNKLKEYGIEAEAVQVVDNNCIDKHVSRFKPTHCFIEALWVVPSKFEALAKLHPKVKWIVRLHSMIPFLVSEGMAFEWIQEYIQLRNSGIKLELSCNNEVMTEDMRKHYGNFITYSPNIYFPKQVDKKMLSKNILIDKNALNIGCFGALRVLKNHAQQAMWAMDFAESLGKKMHFHVNISEHEQREAGPVLRNMRAMFASSNHKLIEHPWYEHKDFINIIRHMDMGMQVSFTETFNIVAADFVNAGIPIVVSNEIKFVNPICRAEPTRKANVISALICANSIFRKLLCKWNKILLDNHNKQSVTQWLNIIQ